MKRLLAAIATAVLLTGCANLRQVAESPDTFAICKAADVITTAVALNSGAFHEANPLLKPFIGPHNIFPLVAFSFALWWVIQHYNEPKLTLAANVITCGVAGHNAVLLLK